MFAFMVTVNGLEALWIDPTQPPKVNPDSGIAESWTVEFVA
jgi:hypothetical protein